MNSWDDIQLVSRVAVLHDRRAFDTLVKRHQETIRRFFLNQTCGDTQLSDDLAQDTFVKAYLNIAQFQGMEKMDLYQALQQLTETERTCVSLQLMEGQSIERIAEITAMNANTIKSHLARGKKKLVTYLKANGYDR